MTEAMEWSVMKWLREKKRVRRTADEANAVLDHLSADLKLHWPDRLKAASDTLGTDAGVLNFHALPDAQKKKLPVTDAESLATARKIRDADEEAFRARMDAERTFDDAEKQLSTRLAREGCLKAIRSWELKEKAIRKSEEASMNVPNHNPEYPTSIEDSRMHSYTRPGK